jgi:hypothetical protein
MTSSIWALMSVDRDIEERCKAASRAYGRLMPVWKAPLRVETNLRVFKAMVEPVMFYACETWPLTVGREKKLTRRQIVNCRWPYVSRPLRVDRIGIQFEITGENFKREVPYAPRPFLAQLPKREERRGQAIPPWRWGFWGSGS